MTTKYKKLWAHYERVNKGPTMTVFQLEGRPHQSKSRQLENVEKKIPKFITFSLWRRTPRFTSIRNDNGNGNLRGQLTLSAAKFVSSSYINLCYCVSAFRRSSNSNKNNRNRNNNNKRASNKGSQKVSGFITCSNSSISLLTTRRHAKVRKICRARHRLWSDLNHRWDLGFQIPYTIYQIPRFQNPKWVTLIFIFGERERRRQRHK